MTVNTNHVVASAAGAGGPKAAETLRPGGQAFQVDVRKEALAAARDAVRKAVRAAGSNQSLCDGGVSTG
jgi:hypothetical protein